MLASVPAGYIRYTLGAAASELSTGTEVEIVNDVQRVFEACYSWSFLGTRTVPLTLRKGEPYIELPSDFRELIDIQPNPGIVNRIVMSSRAQVALLRTDTLQAFSGIYRAYIDNTPPTGVNLLGYTETLDGATWSATGATVSSNQSTNPASAATAADHVLQGSAVSDNMLQAVAAAELKDGHDYLFSIYVKQVDAETSAISIEQRGVGGGVAGTTQPKTVATLTWTAGVPAVTASTSQGDGLHTASSESVGDGWYRVWVALTWNADPEMASTDLAVSVLPETTATSGNNGIAAWGAQLEDIELHEDPQPTRYVAASGAYSSVQVAPVRRLGIWPTPTDDEMGAFVLNYRRKLPNVSSESDVIAIPDFAEPFFNQLARVYARGIHEEDEFDLDARLAPLLQGPLYMNAISQDQTSQRDFGPMRGSASEGMYSMRDWNNQTTIPNPT